MRQLRVVPANDIWFSLDIDCDKNPMGVVVSAGHDTEGWKYLGPKLSGKRTIQAKIICLGYVRNLFGAKDKADMLGYRLVVGQAQDSFKDSFQICDNIGPVILGGSEWRNPIGKYNVIALTNFKGKHRSLFHRSDDFFLGYWRWLVTLKNL